MKEINDTARKDEEMRTLNGESSMGRKQSGFNWSGLLRTIFGIFMIIVYVGMGVLLFINFFQWDPAWNWLRWVGGGIFVLYGIWRAYRQFMGIDSRL